jgi:DNA-binding MarR family transcriptional regulator
MKKEVPFDLTQDLFKLMRQVPRLKFKQGVVEGLTRSEYELLVILEMNIYDKGTAMSVSEISNLLQITPAAITHIINPLEEKRFIKRLPDPKDRRVVLIGLTDKGAKTADALIADVKEQVVGLINYLGEKDSREFVRLLSRAFEYFESQPEK